jgi:DNA-binding NarL/FixJ family response regulator
MAIVLVITVLLVLPEWFVFPGSTDAPHQERHDDFFTLSQICARLSRQHGLTARETDVLNLLARGRDFTIIARELNISRGTAHTHTKHIYSKMNMHNKQELIDYIESNRLPSHEIESNREDANCS